jgi:hypothetical protein
MKKTLRLYRLGVFLVFDAIGCNFVKLYGNQYGMLPG